MHDCTPPPGRTASALRLQVALDELAQPGQTMVVLAGATFHPAEGIRRIQIIDGQEDLFDIEPVLGPVEQRLACEEVLGREDRDALLAERDDPFPLTHLVVELVIRQEDVDRVPFPPQSHLTVPLSSSGVVLPRCDPERLQCVLETPEVLRSEEDVDVDVVRGAGLGVVSECQCPAEGVIDPARLELAVDRLDLFG